MRTSCKKWTRCTHERLSRQHQERQTLPLPRPSKRQLLHQPRANANTTAAATHAASILAATRRKPSAHLIDTVLSFTDRASIQAVLDTLVRLVISGRISNERARIILRACSVAAHNFDPALDTLTGPVPQQHEWFAYFDKVESLLTTVDPLLHEAAEHDAEGERDESA
jgi:hypothetical protein